MGKLREHSFIAVAMLICYRPLLAIIESNNIPHESNSMEIKRTSKKPAC